MSFRRYLACCAVLLASAVSAHAHATVLDTVKQRGVLDCGTDNTAPGFGYLNTKTGKIEGLDADLCRAMAAAVLGSAEKVKFIVVTDKSRFNALQTGQADVVFAHTTVKPVRESAVGIDLLRELPSLIGLVALVGCASLPPPLTQEEARANPDTDGLCQFYHTTHEARRAAPTWAAKNMAVIRAELIRRGATSEAEWEMTDAGTIRTGMRKCIVFALFGKPATTTISDRVSLYQFQSADIVIFRDGVVTSFTIANPR